MVFGTGNVTGMAVMVDHQEDENPRSRNHRPAAGRNPRKIPLGLARSRNDPPRPIHRPQGGRTHRPNHPRSLHRHPKKNARPPLPDRQRPKIPKDQPLRKGPNSHPRSRRLPAPPRPQHPTRRPNPPRPPPPKASAPRSPTRHSKIPRNRQPRSRHHTTFIAPRLRHRLRQKRPHLHGPTPARPQKHRLHHHLPPRQPSRLRKNGGPLSTF